MENTSGKDLIVANDLLVNSGENFTLTQLIYHSFHQGFEPIDSVDIIYYSDNNGLPGNIIGTEDGVIPSSLIEMGDFGLEIYEVTLDVTPFIFAGNSNETIYWIGLVGNSSNGGTYIGKLPPQLQVAAPLLNLLKVYTVSPILILMGFIFCQGFVNLC